MLLWPFLYQPPSPHAFAYFLKNKYVTILKFKHRAERTKHLSTLSVALFPFEHQSHHYCSLSKQILNCKHFTLSNNLIAQSNLYMLITNVWIMITNVSIMITNHITTDHKSQMVHECYCTWSPMTSPWMSNGGGKIEWSHY